MINTDDLDSLQNAAVVDPSGDLIGSLTDIYLNEDTDQPEWIVVVGAGGTDEAKFAPLAQAHIDGGRAVLAVPKEVVLAAPRVTADSRLSEQDRALLYRHYGDQLQHNAAPGPDEHTMIRSEERLLVDTETVVTGRARLRKYVVTEDVTRVVAISHEELRVTREPITEDGTDDSRGGDARPADSELNELEYEIVLHAQRPVVAKETVPVERVRLTTETVTGEDTVTETLRTEHIDEPEVDQPEIDEPGIDRPDS